MVPPLPPTDRRACPRRPRRLRVLIASSKQDRQEPILGWIIDRSRGGLRLASPERFKEGTKLEVKPTSAPARARWIHVQVKHCRLRGNHFEIGCQFASPPSVVTLLLLG